MLSWWNFEDVLIDPKCIGKAQQEDKHVHRYFCARVEHLFARLWKWRIIRNMWMGAATELHGHLCILLHLKSV